MPPTATDDGVTLDTTIDGPVESDVPPDGLVFVGGEDGEVAVPGRVVVEPLDGVVVELTPAGVVGSRLEESVVSDEAVSLVGVSSKSSSTREIDDSSSGDPLSDPQAPTTINVGRKMRSARRQRKCITFSSKSTLGWGESTSITPSPSYGT